MSEKMSPWKMKVNKVLILSKLRSYISAVLFRKRARRTIPEDVKEKVLWKNRMLL